MSNSVNDDFGDYNDEDEHDPDLIMDDQMGAQLEVDGFSVKSGGTYNRDGMDVSETGEPYVDYSDMYDNIDVKGAQNREGEDDQEDSDATRPHRPTIER
jgi:hypothetical protein